MTDCKLVIRRLPPSMKEEDFLNQVSPLSEHNYFCFFEANTCLGPHSYARAYINFTNTEDTNLFKEKFDNYIFMGKDGQEYPAVVEQSLWHKCPRNGPFYKESHSDCISQGPSDQDENDQGKQVIDSLTEDPEFLEFLEKLQAQKEKPRGSPIQTLENNLDELTNSSLSSLAGKDNSKVMTPLIGYVNQKKSSKNSNRKNR